jgi:exopolysaccharide production protein ExoY
MNQPKIKGDEGEKLRVDPAELPTWKRMFDLGLMLLAAPVLLPLVVLIALWILAVSGRPLLYRQQRIGFLGREFTCFKFRTMQAGADTRSHESHAQGLIESGLPMVKMDLQGDPRLIPFALPIRSSGLDELPQLFNVLRGEMSLVGPRPCLPCEYEKYQSWQRERFSAIPGITGLWQVSGKNKTTFVEMVQLDIHYARSRSLWNDFKILLKTVPALIVQMHDTRTKRKGLSSSSNRTQGVENAKSSLE